VKNLIVKVSKVNIGEEFWVKSETGIQGASGFENIGNIISNLVKNVYVIAGVVLFILLIVGGVGFIMGAGADNPEKAKRGKQAISAALIGFVIIFCSYWIIKIIEIITGVKIFNPNL